MRKTEYLFLEMIFEGFEVLPLEKHHTLKVLETLYVKEKSSWVFYDIFDAAQKENRLSPVNKSMVIC